MKEYCNETMRMVEAAAPALNLLNRVRIVTPLDFIDVLDYIKSRQRDNFKYWFQQTTYDVRRHSRFVCCVFVRVLSYRPLDANAAHIIHALYVC